MQRREHRVDVVRPQPVEVARVLVEHLAPREQRVGVDHVDLVGCAEPRARHPQPDELAGDPRPGARREQRQRLPVVELSPPFGPPREMLSWNRYHAPRISVSPMTSCRSLTPRMNPYAPVISSRVVSTGSSTDPSAPTSGRIVYAYGPSAAREPTSASRLLRVARRDLLTDVDDRPVRMRAPTRRRRSRGSWGRRRSRSQRHPLRRGHTDLEVHELLERRHFVAR